MLWLTDQLLSAVMILHMNVGWFDAHLEVIGVGFPGSTVEVLRALMQEWKAAKHKSGTPFAV